MTDQNKTAIALVVDRSGSMAVIREEAQNTINNFIEEQQKLPGECLIKIAQFDNVYEVVTPYARTTDIKNLGAEDKFILKPRNTTALHDAIGKTITELGQELAALPEDERPGTVIVAIITDGFENASQEYTAQAVKKLVEEQANKYNWKFVFLAANQDAILTGSQYGFSRGSSMTFAADGAGVRNIGVALASYATATRSGQSYEFTDSDRESAVDSNV